MIIRDQRRRLPFYRFLMVILPLALIGVIAFLLIPSTPEDDFVTYFCDAETVSQRESGTFFVGNDAVEFGEGMHQSQVKARSGKFSCLPTEKVPWGMTLVLKDLVPGERFDISVWRNSGLGEGELLVDPSWATPYSGKESGTSDGDWDELTSTLEVPYYAKGAEAKIYVFRPGKTDVYFDDLKVVRVPGNTREEMALLPADSVRTLNLVIEDHSYRKLEAKRTEAMQRGLLVTESDDWVKARLEEGKDNFKVKIRLKGDWTDHLRGDKWSFRIAVAEGQAWNGMTTFSVQHPATRSYLQEWFFHRWLLNEGLLAPRYDIIQLKINGESRGIYAYEEHFVKQLPESNERRQGPVLKFVEDGLWEAEEKYSGEKYPDIEDRIPRFIASEIAPFEEGDILKDSVLNQQFQIARDLMHAYKHNLKPPAEIFDMEKVARYYAIVDICKAQHAFIWHNQRLYYNPVLSRLEPIGFDGYTSEGPLYWIKKPFIGYAQNFRYMAPPYKAMMFERFFNDPEFVASYVRALEHYSSEDYLIPLVEALAAEVDERERLIQREWMDYKYDRDFILNEAKKIRMVLFPLRKNSVKAYLGKNLAGKQQYQVFNYHCLPVRLLGVGNSPDQLSEFTLDTLLPSYANDFPPEMIKLKAEGTGKNIYFEVPGLDSIFSAEILPWEAPGLTTPEQELFSGLKIESNQWYEVNEDLKEVRFRRGSFQVKEDILFPKGYVIRADGGTEIDLIQGAKFISKSRILFNGREDSPIVIRSSDGTGMGLSLLQLPDGQKSEFHFVLFEGMTSLNYKGWNLTGAVTVYEAEVLFHNCRFVNNQSEDGLNIVRSVFTLSNCYFGYTSSDAFDADFCTGLVDNCYFSHTTNDAMDFSGGTILIASAFVDYAGDKAISFGEESKGTVLNVEIKNSLLGIASKDLSEVMVEKVALENVKEGFLVYQKKAEYGPGNLEVQEVKQTKVERLYRIQAGSKLLLEKDVIEGNW